MQSLTFSRIGQGSDISLVEAGLTEAYAKLGIDVRFKDMPAERALMASNLGHVDGEMARLPGIEAQYPNLRRVEGLLYHLQDAVFVYGPRTPRPKSLQEVLNFKSLATLLGHKGSHEPTANWPNATQLTSYESALNMLRLGRVDAFLGHSEDVRTAIATLGLNQEDFPSLAVTHTPMYHFVHKSHDRLVTDVERSIKAITGAHKTLVNAMRARQRA